jgi:hypothetical protein
MTRSFLRNALIAFGVLGLLLAPMGLVLGEEGSVEKFKVKLLGVETFYGQEKWKTSPAFQGANQQALESDAGQYDGALGYRIALRIQLTDEAGNNVPADPIENRNINLSAVLKTSRGDVPAYVQRNPGTIPGQSDSLIFRLFFDLDGTNAGPGRNPMHSLTSGPSYVRINIFKQAATGGRIDAGQDDLVFNYQRPTSTITIDGFGERDYVAEVPDNTFRLLNDIGEGATVPFITEQVADTSTLRASYAFGVPGKTVRWMAFTATPCSSATCAPIGGVARTEVFMREIGLTKTDAIGNVSFSVPVKDLLSYAGRSAPLPAALVVVAAALVPETDLPADLGSQYAKGGFDILAGADEFVIPIGSRIARVTGYAIDTRLQEGFGNSSAPKPIKDQAAAVNSLTVKIYDDAGTTSGLGCANCGDAVAVVPDGIGKVLGNGTIRSVADPVLANKYREASIPARDIQAAKVSWYRILALFYGSAGNGERDVFQGMTYADRGFLIETGNTPARISDQGTYYFNITSRSTNYDLRSSEPDFQMKVLYRVQTENGFNKNETISLPEGGVSNQQIKLSSSRVGTLAITYEATSGDTLVGPLSDSAVFHDRAPKKKLSDRIPGFEVLALALALCGAMILLRRREAF